MLNTTTAPATGVMLVQVNNVFTYQLTATPTLDVSIDVQCCRV